MIVADRGVKSARRLREGGKAGHVERLVLDDDGRAEAARDLVEAVERSNRFGIVLLPSPTRSPAGRSFVKRFSEAA